VQIDSCDVKLRVVVLGCLNGTLAGNNVGHLIPHLDLQIMNRKEQRDTERGRGRATERKELGTRGGVASTESATEAIDHIETDKERRDKQKERQRKKGR